jgi:hypothetical protein
MVGLSSETLNAIGTAFVCGDKLGFTYCLLSRWTDDFELTYRRPRMLSNYIVQDKIRQRSLRKRIFRYFVGIGFIQGFPTCGVYYERIALMIAVILPEIFEICIVAK